MFDQFVILEKNLRDSRSFCRDNAYEILFSQIRNRNIFFILRIFFFNDRFVSLSKFLNAEDTVSIIR